MEEGRVRAGRTRHAPGSVDRGEETAGGTVKGEPAVLAHTICRIGCRSRRARSIRSSCGLLFAHGQCLRRVSRGSRYGRHSPRRAWLRHHHTDGAGGPEMMGRDAAPITATSVPRPAQAPRNQAGFSGRIVRWSVTSALAGFLFGFDTVVISGA